MSKTDSDPAPILSARSGDLLGIFDSIREDRDRRTASNTKHAVKRETPDLEGEYPKPPIVTGDKIHRGIAGGIRYLNQRV